METRLKKRWLAAGLAAGVALFAIFVWASLRGPDGLSATGVVASAAFAIAAGIALVTRAIQAGQVAPLRAELAGRELEIARLAAELARAQGADSHADHDRRWLETVLCDLAEAVIVADPRDRILLFNPAAEAWLAPTGPVGLRRDLATLVDLAPVHSALAGDPHAQAALDLRTADQRGPFAARLSLLRDAKGDPEAYVLAARVPPAPKRAAHGPRPEFHDFALARLAPAGGAAGKRPLESLAYVVFDLETTGLDTRNDAIVSMGAVRALGSRVLESESFATLVDPGRPIPPLSTSIHGIDDEAVKGAPDQAKAARAFAAFAHDSVLVAHNAAFDLAFLKRAGAACGLEFDHPPFDTLLIARWLFPDLADHSLDGLAALLGVEIGKRHSALDDSRATARVFARLLAVCAARGIDTYDELVEASNMALGLRASDAALRSASP
jgi:DNA polymerase III subunit epsilon